MENVASIDEKLDEEKLFAERKEKAISFLKAKYNWISYLILAIIVWISIKIRTANINGLRDITTGGWTLGPDLDPFLFMRWAKHIVATGSLMAVDTIRNVPLGFATKQELILLPYLIAWFHKIAVFFGSVSVEQSAAIFPVAMFALTVIAFFLFVRKVFIDSLGDLNANIIALIASLFFTLLPSLLPRTIAGIPEKESTAFLFMFLAFYFFLSSWKSSKHTPRIIYSVLAGTATAMTALVWGGVIYVFLSMTIAMLFAFFTGQFDKERIYLYAIWLFSSFAIMAQFSLRYYIKGLFTSTITGSSFFVLLVVLVHFLIFNTKIKSYFEGNKLSKVPKHLVSIVLTLVLGIIALILLFGFDYITFNIKTIISQLTRPLASDRFVVTVAENRIPFFNEIGGSFGPSYGNIPIFFWLFFIGSIYLFIFLTRFFERKERIYLSIIYTIFLSGVFFSRYSPSSTFNGDNFISNLFYFGGILLIAFASLFYYYKYYRQNKLDKLGHLDIGIVLVLAFFFFTAVSARGVIRFILLLVPPASILAGYLIVKSFNDALKVKEDLWKIVSWGIVAIIIFSSAVSAYNFYQISSGTAQGYVPGAYNQQWQKAMQWTRENTKENAVFGHWWDYGYWVQSIGERATVLDGANQIVYWNYMMGRYALTGTDNFKAADFLYSHNTTHFLIDSTDIGKYSAFSSIGSDENYDRFSWINAFLKDARQTFEEKNTTSYVYVGGTPLDEDIIYEINGTRIFLPADRAAVGALIIKKDSSGNTTQQPTAVFVYQDKRYDIPLRYAFDTNDNKFLDFNSGLEAGVFIMPAISQTGAGIQVDKDGALFYLSNRTVKSQLARLYLYDENNPYFKLAHVEDDTVVEQLKAQGVELGNFVHLEGAGFRGPIKIWEIKYPAGMQVKEEYLTTQYPNEELKRVRS